jgi:hypothetical protein
LQGDDNAVRRQKILQERDHFLVALLLGHEEDDVVGPLHLFRKKGRYRLRLFHGTHDAGPAAAQRLHLRAVVIDKVDARRP